MQIITSKTKEKKSIFLERSENKTKETHFEIGLGILYLWYKNQRNLFFSQKSLVVSKVQSHLKIDEEKGLQHYMAS